MKTLADLEAEHAEARAKLETEHALAKLAPAAPDFVLPSKKGPAWISYKGRSLSQALELLPLFECVPLYRWQGTFCQLVPDGCEDSGSEMKGGPFALYVDVNQGKGFGPSASLVFFAAVADPSLPDQRRILRVSIDINGPQYIGAFDAFRASVVPVKVRQGYREVTEWRVGPNGTLGGMADSYVRWAGGDAQNARFSYCFMADDESPAPFAEMTHALGMLTNLRDEFQPAAELIESTARADYYRIPGVKGAADVFAAVKPGDPAPANAAGYYTLESLKSLKGDS